MIFDYRALNPEGASITGTLDTENQRSAIRDLSRQRLTPISVTPRSNTRKRGNPTRSAKSSELLLVMHQLTMLLRSGVSLDEAVASLAESQENPFLARELEQLSITLRRGGVLSEALRESSLKLPEYIYFLAESGELTGNLPGALTDGVAQMEYERQIGGELRNALIYPSILIVSGITAVMLIFTLVVPKFSKLLEKSGGEVPFLARAVLTTGQFMNDNMGILLGVVLALGTGATLTLTKPAARQRLWDALLHVPLIGPWLLEADIGRWASMLATLIASRVELTRALELAQKGVASTRLTANFSQVTKAVRGGSSLAEALKESGAITATGYGLVRVGERSGELAAMLRSLATLYIDSGRDRMKSFLALLEPIAILSIGGVIGLIMTGIILAITSVNDIAM